MVLKYSIDGGPYRIPPYSKAELEEMRRPFDDPLICYFSNRRSAPPPQDQEPPELPPADIPPEREQP
jgi:hypothetical protein